MAQRTILLDASVVEQIGEGNTAVAEKLRDFLKPDSGVKVYITQAAYEELTGQPGKLSGGTGPDLPRTSAANQRLLDDLGLRPPPTSPEQWASVKDTLERNGKAGGLLTPEDARSAAQTIAVGGEFWTMDQKTFTGMKSPQQAQNLKKTFPGLNVAPESTIPVQSGNRSDYRVARKAMGLSPIIVSFNGTITEPPSSGPGSSGGGTGGKGGTNAYVGEKDMTPVEVGGPSPDGVAKIGGIQLAFEGINFLLNWANDYQNKEKIKADLQKIGRGIAQNRMNDPTQGCLLVFYYKPAPDAGPSLIRPGPQYRFVEDFYGHSEDEALVVWRNTNSDGMEPGLVSDTHWIPPIAPVEVKDLKVPFAQFALGSFEPGQEMLQGVIWNGVAGFDDLWEKKLQVPADVTPSFLILKPPDKIKWWYQAGPTSGQVMETTIPVVWLDAASGGKVPAVDLDPWMPFCSVAATMVFPADDDTDELFATRRATQDNLGQLGRYINIGKMRWVRPQHIRINSPWSAVDGPGKFLTSVSPRGLHLDRPDPRYIPKASELAPRDQWGTTPGVPAGSPRIYIVGPNDNLSKIAAKFYGDPAKWTKIYEANKEKIDPKRHTIYPGQKLVVPDDSKPGTPEPASPKPFDPNMPIA